MKPLSSPSDRDSWASTRELVQLPDGSYITREVLTSLPMHVIEELTHTQRGSHMGLIGLDFETYGSVNLPKHGLDRYVSDQYFRPLIVSVFWVSADGIRMKKTFDFVENFDAAKRDLALLLSTDSLICAHNAGFEKAVLDWLGIDIPLSRFIDSAVVARAAGGGSRLEAAAPQLLGVDKMPEGRDLIKLFSIPGKYQEKYDSLAFHQEVVSEHPDEWQRFKDYCELDAELSHDLVKVYKDQLPFYETKFQELTMQMNQVGWPVDVAAVEEMQRRYLENREQALADFRRDCDAEDLNLGSGPQLKVWCAERGIRSNSFDETNVERLLKKVGEKLTTMSLDDPKHNGYAEVHRMLETKQILGGSSLKKLQVILDRVGHDGRLRDQYLHCGAGQTLRTTGTGVQMQNLTRLAEEPRSMAELFDDEQDWTNTDMAENLRQVFTSSHPSGRLIVGDFKSVENVGLAWLAGQDDKLDAFRNGLDLYKVQAEKTLGIPYELVTKPQRTFGKVGELGCGYQAGPGAVKDFAAGMGVELTEAEAAEVVFGWRDTNPKIVEFWELLNQLLLDVVVSHLTYRNLLLKDGFVLELRQAETPRSLKLQHPDAQSIQLRVLDNWGKPFLVRVFHGCHRRGRNVGYYKPSDLKTGDLWKNHYTDPKTKQLRFYELYGGKLAGILTQSFCRELFFRSLDSVCRWAEHYSNVTPLGQFHDEIIVDWVPGGPITHDRAIDEVTQMMSDPGPAISFPLAADVKSDYRYIK